MLALSPSCRYFLYTQPVTISSSFYKLAAIVSEQMHMNPLAGDVFIFFNRKATHVKLLQWQLDGFAIYYKRLEKGTFEIPGSLETQQLLTSTQLMLILQGIRLDKVQYRKRYLSQSSAH
jgi:Transposase and inactivated derivatives